MNSRTLSFRTLGTNSVATKSVSKTALILTTSPSGKSPIASNGANLNQLYWKSMTANTIILPWCSTTNTTSRAGNILNNTRKDLGPEIILLLSSWIALIMKLWLLLPAPWDLMLSKLWKLVLWANILQKWNWKSSLFWIKMSKIINQSASHFRHYLL